MTRKCTDCDGTGWVYLQRSGVNSKECPRCKGSGLIENHMVKRVQRCNELLHLVATTGREFFNNNGHISKFIFDEDGLRFVDHHKGKQIKHSEISEYGRIEGFNSGSTLQHFVFSLKNYIIESKPINHSTVHWGYGVDQKGINDKMDFINELLKTD